MLKPIWTPKPDDRDIALANGYDVEAHVQRPTGIREAFATTKIIYRVKDPEGEFLSDHWTELEAWAAAADIAKAVNNSYAIEKRKSIIRPVDPTSPFWQGNPTPTEDYLDFFDDVDLEVVQQPPSPVHPAVLRSNRLHELQLLRALEQKTLPQGCEANLKIIKTILQPTDTQ